MLNVTITYTRTDPAASFTPWVPPSEYVNFVVTNYENTGLKSVPAAAYHFADDHVETVSTENPQPWTKNWTVLVKTLTFQNLTAYNNFHAESIVQSNIGAEINFYAPQGVSFTRTYTGE